MKTIFGIDLGTTNSCISWLNNGQPEVISIQGSPLVPSVVSFGSDEVIVGVRARNREVLDPGNTVSSVKRIMGTDQLVDISGEPLSPEKISSYILDFLKVQAQEILGLKVEHVVITVPAYFSDAQRRATRNAGLEAGLKVERIINEPTAAALFYTHADTGTKSSGGRDHVLVYDLGGGTFDVSVLRMGEINEVLASSGNTELGGNDFDQAVVRLCLDRIMQSNEIDLRSYRPALARLRAAAEAAKISLSFHPFSRIEESLIPNPKNREISVSLEIAREQFEEIIAPYLETTKKEVDTALAESGLKTADIDNVLLVGGSTRIPAVISLLEGYFGSSCMPAIDPDLSVARGAAIQGGIITGAHIHQVLVDVNPHTLSTEALQHDLTPVLKCVPIIPRNTQIPVTRSELFYTVFPYQEKVRVTVYQGESTQPDENTLIGSMDLRLVPAPANSPVLIEYGYDLNGIIKVRVEQKGYSAMREINLDSSRQDQMFLEVDLDKDQDDQDMDPEAAGEDDARITNYILHKSRDVLDTLEEGEEKNTLNALIADYEKALKGDDEDLVDEVEEALVDYLDQLQDRGE